MLAGREERWLVQVAVGVTGATGRLPQPDIDPSLHTPLAKLHVPVPNWKSHKKQQTQTRAEVIMSKARDAAYPTISLRGFLNRIITPLQGQFPLGGVGCSPGNKYWWHPGISSWQTTRLYAFLPTLPYREAPKYGPAGLRRDWLRSQRVRFLLEHFF